MAIDDDTFFDIHMHAFNLSHPYFYAFIKRYPIGRILFLTSIASLFTLIPIIRDLIIRFIVNPSLRKVRNLLSIFENDIGSFFLITENCLREKENPLLKGDRLSIGDRTYTNIVITPLMMDFGQKGKGDDRDVHYHDTASKPVVEQVFDVFNAIRWYREASYSQGLGKAYHYLGEDTSRLMEMYPFLGINTQNYEMDKIQNMLDKYFKDYTGLRGDLLKNMGQFDGNIENIRSNCFAGIKVYPPLGFDPWPGLGKEQEKVEYLYAFCVQHGIPVTTHGSEGGFVAVSNRQMKRYAAISKLGSVLKHFPSLKLNIAHFPAQHKVLGFFPGPETQRLEDIKRLVLDYENVYTDFSCRAVSDKYYICLRKVLDGLSKGDKAKLTSRILFGSDYAVSLGGINSYNEYLNYFSKTTYLKPEEKHAFCCVNPQHFLFADGGKIPAAVSSGIAEERINRV